MKKPWLQLLNQRWRDSERHEDREESRLHIDITVPQVPEGERVEQAGEDVKHELALELSGIDHS